VPVLGGSGDLDDVLARCRADAVLVTIPDAEPAVLDEVVRACGRAGVPCRFVRRQIVDSDSRVPLGVAAE
jgi:hypothetical protein